MKAKHLLFLLYFIDFQAFSQILKVIEKPISWTENRRKLSIEYLKERHGLIQSEPTIKPQMVVCHWTAIPTFEASFKTFNKDTISESRVNLKNASQLNVSAHYLVDRDGTVYHLLPDTVFARHTIGLNYMAIGIENVGDGNKNKLTEAQMTANELLIRRLCKKYKIEYLIGHHEYLTFKGSALWKESDDNYKTTKTDPGDEFMNELRKRLKKYKLKSRP